MYGDFEHDMNQIKRNRELQVRRWKGREGAVAHVVVADVVVGDLDAEVVRADTDLPPRRAVTRARRALLLLLRGRFRFRPGPRRARSRVRGVNPPHFCGGGRRSGRRSR